MNMGHATINRWVTKFTPLLEHNLRRKKKVMSGSWRMDGTYIQVKGEWLYDYRAVDKCGHVVDYYLSPNHDEAAAKAFLNKALT
ncbi:DDE-type integrase/transposase/recombinase [Vibrio mediterranei]|uniref:DDE-type integrase/transposase/recombinase n=1 Tax=Vibrio mediterranei TaxID=689 RepID=UPI001EFCE4C5|nr:DDE-type integrase/transposase/recombinase [Vibrio mediterranei]